MKFVSFTHNDGFVRGGVLDDQAVQPLRLTHGDDVLQHIVSGEDVPATEGSRIPLAEVRLMAPCKGHRVSSASV